MRSLMLAGAAALALVTASALPAQDAGPAPAPEPVPVPAEAAEPAPDTTAEANTEANPLPTTVETIPGTQPGEPDTVVTTHHGNLTPPPATAMNKSYPLCTRTVQDSCRNPGEDDEANTERGG